MDFNNLEKDIIKNLSAHLDKKLLYHNVEHTREVLSFTEFLAKEENLSEYYTTIVKTAALLHDIGFLHVYDFHEEYSLKIIPEILAKYNYSNEDIKIVNRLIIATEIPIQPKDNLEMILCDADLAYLGHQDYYHKSFLLFTEWHYFNRGMTLKEWYKLQLEFLTNHKFHTKYCIENREPFKQKIIFQIKSMLIT